MYLADTPWIRLDPRRNPFDTAGLHEAIVEARTRKGRARRPMVLTPEQREGFLRDLGDILAVRYGEWVRGWRNSADEGDGSGGPVRAWCCVGHSWVADYAGLAERIAVALGEWRAFLEALAAQFEAARGQLSLVTDDDARAAVAAREFRKLIEVLRAETGGGDEWSRYAAAASSWMFEDMGMDPADARAKIAAAMRSKLPTWQAPKPRVLQAVCDELGLELAVWIDRD